MANDIETTKSNVPALATTPALDIGAEDVALPRMKTGQFMSAVVQDGLVPAGALYTSLGADDPDPVVVEGNDDGVLFHVLGMTRGKSVSEGGELVMYDYHDPDAPADAWVTYNYVVVLPEQDPDFPVKWLLTRTSRPAAQQINLVLAKTSDQGPPYLQAFRASTVERENKKGKYFVIRVKHEEADPKNIEVCEKLAGMVSADPASVQASGDEPAI